jgi:hypothetical protein
MRCWENSLGVVPAKAGTHGMFMKDPRIWLTWIPAFAGMTLRSTAGIASPKGGGNTVGHAVPAYVFL